MRKHHCSVSFIVLIHHTHLVNLFLMHVYAHIPSPFLSFIHTHTHTHPPVLPLSCHRSPMPGIALGLAPPPTPPPQPLVGREGSTSDQTDSYHQVCYEHHICGKNIIIHINAHETVFCWQKKRQSQPLHEITVRCFFQYLSTIREWSPIHGINSWPESSMRALASSR